MDNYIAGKNTILIIDDDFINRELLKNIFSSQYIFREASNGREGLAQIGLFRDELCAIILDVQMPELSGIELLSVINEWGITEKVPTFLITAHDDEELVASAYGLGVMDVVSKPVTPIVVQKRVKTVIELFSAREHLSATVEGQAHQLSENARVIDELQLETLEALATAIEFRDVESGQHVSRIHGMTRYILACTSFGAGLSEHEIECISRGAIMHDVGKIAISDVILNKPGRLTREEFEIMKTHSTKGEELMLEISRSQSHDSYRYACDIARHHHERWDGRGYPDGLRGEEISVAAQVVSIVDVYDALVSDRVYKKAFEPERAVEMIAGGECGVFNPRLVEAFLEAEPVFRRWYTAEGGDEALALYMGSARRSAEPARPQPTASTVDDTMLLMTAVQTAYDMIISVNLTQNTFYMMDNERFMTTHFSNDGCFDELIDRTADSIPVSHRREFHDTFCRENLLQAYHAGRKSVSLEYTQYDDAGKLRWCSTKVLFLENSRSGDILEITLVQYADEEHAEKERARKILASAQALVEQAGSVGADVLSRMNAEYDQTEMPENSSGGGSRVCDRNALSWAGIHLFPPRK